MNNKGFTLIELMVAVAIIGILASIAIPNYNEYIRKSKRQEAITALNELQQAQAKLRANCRWYAQSTGPENDCDNVSAAASTVEFTTFLSNYDLTITGASATAYTATMEAKAGQASDTDCDKIILTVSGANPNGAKTSLKSDGTASDGTCW